MSSAEVLKSRGMNTQQPPSPTKHTSAKPTNNLHRQALASSNSSNSKENQRCVWSRCYNSCIIKRHSNTSTVKHTSLHLTQS